MAERWQTSEGRTAAVYFEDASGPTPLTGLAPTATTYYKDGTGGAPAATVTEVGGGFYRVTLASAPTKDVLVRVYGGTTTAGYAAQEIPVGGYVDSVDATVSSRATASAVTALGSPAQASAVTALGSPAQASALATVQADTDALQVDMATMLARLTSARATLLDLLANLDVAVSTRSKPSDVDPLARADIA